MLKIFLFSFSLLSVQSMEGKISCSAAISAAHTGTRALLKSFVPLKEEFLEASLSPLLVPYAHITTAIRNAKNKASLKEALIKHAKEIKAMPLGHLYFLLGFLGHVYFTLDQEELEEKTKDFEKDLGTKPYVFVSMVPKGDRLEHYPKGQFEADYSKIPNTFFIEAKDYSDLVEKLGEVLNKTGGIPIKGMQLFAHGFPGSVGDIDTKSIEDRVASGFLDENARIRLIACSSLAGKSGEDLARALGETFLQRGGNIYGAKVTTQSAHFVGQQTTILANPIIDHPLSKYIAMSQPYSLLYSYGVSFLNKAVDPTVEIFPSEKIFVLQIPPKK